MSLLDSVERRFNHEGAMVVTVDRNVGEMNGSELSDKAQPA